MTSDIVLSELHQDPLTGLHFRRRICNTAPRARLLLLHGVGGNETNLTRLINYLPNDVELLFLRAPLQMGPQGYAWFQVSFTNGGPIINEPQAEASRELLIQFVRSQPHLPTIIAGFSQGGIMSASVGLSAPIEVVGFGLLSGRILPELESKIAPREQLQRLAAFVAHGRDDEKLPVFWAERAKEWLDILGVACQYRVYDMTHEITEREVMDFAIWVEKALQSEVTKN